MIFIFGSARSGSSWLGKLFDTHPDLLYLHEPDTLDRGSDLIPHWFSRAPEAAEIEHARTYLCRLAAKRALRTVGIRPFFRKSYRDSVSELKRLSLIYGCKFAERAGLSRYVNAAEIPDLVDGATSPRLVIKSVSALGRAEVLLAADSSISPILLIRHPCAFAASMLRGHKLGVIPRVGRLGRMALTRSARRFGLELDRLQGADDVTLLAWTWLISNLEAVEPVLNANGIILNHSDIASDPLGHAKPLFERLGLGWSSQTEDFLARSQKSDGGYYSLSRTAAAAGNQWKGELDRTAVAKIRDIAERDPLGARFFNE